MSHKSIFPGGVIILITTIFVISAMTGCKTQKIAGHWISEPIQIDGQRADWTNIPANYFEDQDIAVGLCNDSENLYLFFSFKNPMWARAIESTGLTLWLDGTAKKKKNLGIRYKGGPPPEELRKNSGFNMPEDVAERMKERDEQQKDSSSQITILDNINYREETLPSSTPAGPAVAFSTSKDIYTYEFRLPLAESGYGQYGFGANPGKFVCIGAEWGEFNMGERYRREGMGGGRPGGGGFPGEGSFPGGYGGGGFERPAGMQRQRPEKQEIWIKTQLAVPPKNAVPQTGSVSTE